MNLAELYFKPKTWEGNGRFYELLGVRYFKKFVVKLGRQTGQNSAKPNNYYLWNRSVEGMKQYERKTRYNEMMHLMGMIIPLIGLMIGENEVGMEIILWVIFAINVHPFLLQRYNRIRLYKAMGK